MGYRNVVVATQTNLAAKNRQLVAESLNGNLTIPIEDISNLVLEDHRTTVTTYLLQELAEEGVVVITCDAKHVPNGMLLPFMSHSRQTRVANMQLAASVPFKKRIWQRIVQQKIINQSLCLQYARKQGSKAIEAMSKAVKSGDSTNREALAAKIYFDYLFGEAFLRKNEDTINACLDYGYAVMRAAVARSIVSYGFIPCFGIHHRSEQNAFNLADDFVEPFRPLVDLWVVTNPPDCESLTQNVRNSLVSLLSFNIEYGEKKHTVLSAIDMMVESYSRACEAQDFCAFNTPTLLDLELREDE